MENKPNLDKIKLSKHTHTQTNKQKKNEIVLPKLKILRKSFWPKNDRNKFNFKSENNRNRTLCFKKDWMKLKG